MTTALPLPGRWIDFGPDVVRVAAHPTRPWVALVRKRVDGVTVEHHDLDASVLLSATEVAAEGHALVWVGDRVAHIVFEPSLVASHVEGGSDRVDVVHAKGHERVPYLDDLIAQPWGVEFTSGHGDGQAFRLSARGESITLIERATIMGRCWHPDDASVHARVHHLDRARGVCAIEIVSAQGIRRLMVPGWSGDLSVEPLGWSAPDRVVVERYELFDQHVGPCEYWSVDTHTGVFHTLNTEVDPSLGLSQSLLSPGGEHLALVTCTTDRNNPILTLSLLDAHTGAT